jgi:hypothetical protein
MSKIQMHLTLTINIPDRGLNVNGLLYGLNKSSGSIMLTLVQGLFFAIEERVIQELQEKKPNRYQRNGYQRAKTLRTSFGPMKYRFSKVLDKRSGKNLVPLRDRLKIPKYRQYQNESMESAIGLSIHLSYQRSKTEIDRIRGSGASRWTNRRRLFEFSDSQCQFMDMKKIPYRFLMADSTKVHLQGFKGKDLGQHPLCWALASTGENKPFDIVGLWIDRSWKDIATDLQERLDYNKLEVLFSDGECDLAEALLKPGMHLQRCMIHGKRDFPYILYADDLKKPEQKPFVDFLKSIPVMQFSKAYMETLSDKDRPKIRTALRKTKESFADLIDMLNPEQYPHASSYISNLAQSVITFLEWWLKNGEWIPFTTNRIENHFSQMKNRIKRIGRRWSDEGLLKWCMVMVHKIFYPNDWDLFWKQYLKINKPISILDQQVSFQWL